MIIHLPTIPESGLQFSAEEPGEILELREGDEFCAIGPVQCDLYAQVVDGLLIVRGTLSVPLAVSCARCTQIFSTTLTDSSFLRDLPVVAGIEEVDLTEDIREALLLSLPHFPLCREGCKGLCARCGEDLNGGSCPCRGMETGGAWSALNQLKL